MTRPPQPPHMPPPEPLDESERALARALRSLPAGTPPPELDARILGAARRAVHLAPPRKRDRRWLVGLSTAATAVLALGVLLKMHGLGRDAVLAPPTADETTSAPAAANAPILESPQPQMAADARAPSETTAQAPMGVIAEMPDAAKKEAQGFAREKDAASVLGASPASTDATSPHAFPGSPTAKPAPLRQYQPPPPPSPPVIFDRPSPMAVQSPAPAPAASPADEREESKSGQDQESRRDAAVDAMAAPAQAGGMLDKAASSRANSDQATANGEPSAGGAAASKAAHTTLPALTDDATLTPAEWIERVRERVRRGDRAGASASLHAFVRAYPGADIPADLLPLLR